MATKRERWGSGERTNKKKKAKKSMETFDTFIPSSCLERLPDNVTLSIMFYLDALSILKLSRVSKRFYHLSQDEKLWINVDMSTLPYMDIRNTKKFINRKLSKNLRRIKIQSGYELRGKAARKPKVDLGVLNTLVEKCGSIIEIQLINCDLTFLNSECCMLLMNSLEKVSFTHCNTRIHWLEQATWPHLSHLSLEHTVKTGEFEIKAIAQNSCWRKTLKSLHLTGCYRINDSCIKVLCQNANVLKSLHLGGTSVTDSCIQYLQNLHDLEELDLSDIKGMGREGVLKIPNLLPSLKLLNISSLEKVDASVSELVVNAMADTKVVTNNRIY